MEAPTRKGNGDGIEDLARQARDLDDPFTALVDDLLQAHEAGDQKAARRILGAMQGLMAGEQELRLEECVDAAQWLREEPPAPDQIIADIFDVGDKIAIIGSSKSRKSFLTLQLCLSIAAGRNCLAWCIRKARKVALIQFEVARSHYHRRLRRMGRSLGISPEAVEGFLKVFNARGRGISGPGGIARIGRMVAEWQPEVIVFDPLYKITEGDENSSRDFKPILQAFDALAEETGAAVAYVHHDAKGWVGERDIRDRGAGSNTLGRDYDACITLTPHATEPDGLVMETLLRNYPPQENFTAVWLTDETGGHRFEQRREIAPVKRTSKTARGDTVPIESYREPALALVKEKPLLAGKFQDQMHRMAGMTRGKVRELFTSLTEGPQPVLQIYEWRTRGKHEKWVGFPDAIERLKRENEV
jgi:hypothetical protein